MVMEQEAERVPALLQKIKTLHSAFSPTERRVMDYISANPEQVIYLSVAELAERSKVSDAAVIRACRRLGVSGYQELKVSLAQDLVSPLQRIHEEIKPDDTSAAVLDKIFRGVAYTLKYTHDTVNLQELERAVAAIQQANRVAVFGLGNSHAIAIDLQHKLMRLGIHATAYTDNHMQAIEASYLTERDVVFAISHSGSSRDIVDSVRLARAGGAQVISLTNIGRSPLSRESDIALHTASQETKYHIVALSSRIAQMALVDTIYTILALHRQNSVEGFDRLEKALGQKKY